MEHQTTMTTKPHYTKTSDAHVAVVLYHEGCIDGIAAEGVATRRLIKDYLQVRSFAVQYKEPVPDLAGFSADTPIYIVDFAYPRDVLLKLKERFPNLVVLDHHKTSQADCEGLDFAIFDMTKSGAQLTWEYFFPDTPEPRLIQLVGDGDLWKFELEDTKAFRVAIQAELYNVPLWGSLTSSRADIAEPALDKLIEEGRAMLKLQDRVVSNAVYNARELNFYCHSAAITVGGLFGSEIGDKLLTCDRGYKIAIIAIIKDPSSVILSFRSTKDVDCSEYARLFGGGGHAQASGAVVSMEKFLELYRSSTEPV